jgi:hypothetical protein
LEVESITAGGAHFKGEIREANQPILEYGFVWSTANSINGLLSRVVLGSAEGNKLFEAVVEHDLVAEKVYYVWAYAKTSSHIIYGDVKSFQSLGSKAPVIDSFQPKTLDWGDTITIAGQYFSAQKNSVHVDIGGVSAQLVVVMRDQIKVIIPEEFIGPKGKLAVSVLGNVAAAKDSVVLMKPEIEGLSPESGIKGQEVIVIGNHFHPSAKNKVTFNGIEASVTSHSKTMIKCKVPEGLSGEEVNVQVISGAQTSESTATFTMIQPVIVNINPLTGTFGEIVTITFDNFAPDLHGAQVKFGSSPAEVLSVTGDAVVVRVPYDVNASSEISVTQAGITMSYPEYFEVTPHVIDASYLVVDHVGEMFTLKGRNFNPIGNNRVFVDGHDANVVTVSTQELLVTVPHEVDVHEASISVEVAGRVLESSKDLRIRWVQRPLPASYFVQDGSVVHFYNGELYMTLGNDYPVEFAAYDVSTQYLRKLKNFAGTPRQNSASFILDGRLYVMGGYVYHSSGGYYEHFNDVWIYDFASDSWMQKKNLPFTAGFSNLTGFSINGSGYLIRGSHVYRYESVTDEWIVINSDAVPGYGSTGTVAGEYYYFKPINIHASNQVDRYDPVSNSWIGVGEFDVFDQTYYAFEYNGMPVFGSWHHFSMYYDHYGSWANYVYPGSGLIRYGFEHNTAMNFLVLTPSHDFEYFSFRPDF